jgi:hypothetical protein
MLGGFQKSHSEKIEALSVLEVMFAQSAGITTAIIVPPT